MSVGLVRKGEAMKSDFHDAGEQDLVIRLMQLPHKILRYHEVESLPQIVLHDLGHDNHFALDKAIYLVDNPEFDCIKGIAGFSREECKFHRENVWEKPEDFSQDMRDARFNEQVGRLVRHGIKRKDFDTHDPDDIKELAQDCGMKNPAFFSWLMRHGNHGVLIFEGGKFQQARMQDLFKQAGTLLSFC